MADRPIARHLVDIPAGNYAVVAVQVHCGAYDVWDWHLSDVDRRAFNAAVEMNTAAKVHKRHPDGRQELWGTFLPQRVVRVGVGGRTVAERAGMRLEGSAGFGAAHGPAAPEKPLASRSRPFVRQADQQVDDNMAHAGARARAERVLGGQGATGSSGPAGGGQ